MEKCIICDEEIERNELNKINGTLIKIKKENKNEIFAVCPACQKKYKNNLKKEIKL